MNIDPEKHESCNCRICNLERELSASREAYLRSVERDDYLTQELTESKAEVERLKEMVMDCAKRSDERSKHLIKRAEKAETLLKQIHAFVEALNPKDNK